MSDYSGRCTACTAPYVRKGEGGPMLSSCYCGGVISWVSQEAPASSEGRKHDNGKRRMDLIPPEALEALADVLTMGAAKYADRNWEKGFAWGRSVAALMRHLWAWMRGEDKDPESGLSHMAHVLCNAAFLVTFEARGIGTDDRPSTEA